MYIPHPRRQHHKLLVMYVVCGFVVVNDLECLYSSSVIDGVAV